MKKKRILEAVLVISATFLAQASSQASITMDFEGLGDGEPVLNFYSGGTSSWTGTVGPNYGVSFDSPFDGSVQVASTLLDGSALITAKSGNNFVQVVNPSGLMTVNGGGFVGSISFWYYLGQSSAPITVTWRNGVGNSVDANFSVTGGWTKGQIDLGNNVATSVVFSGDASSYGLDDITVTAVPEPGTWAAGFMMLGLLSPTLLRRRATGAK